MLFFSCASTPLIPRKTPFFAQDSGKTPVESAVAPIVFDYPYEKLSIQVEKANAWNRDRAAGATACSSTIRLACLAQKRAFPSHFHLRVRRLGPSGWRLLVG